MAVDLGGGGFLNAALSHALAPFQGVHLGSSCPKGGQTLFLYKACKGLSLTLTAKRLVGYGVPFSAKFVSLHESIHCLSPGFTCTSMALALYVYSYIYNTWFILLFLRGRKFGEAPLVLPSTPFLHTSLDLGPRTLTISFIRNPSRRICLLPPFKSIIFILEM